jgi:hypothetical protein
LSVSSTLIKLITFRLQLIRVRKAFINPFHYFSTARYALLENSSTILVWKMLQEDVFLDS